MVNERILEHKIGTFFNSLSPEEASAFRRFTMTKKWAEYFTKRVNNQKIDL